MNSASSRWMTSREVADLIHASPSAVLRWIDEGRLKAFRTPGGHRRVEADRLVEFLKEHHMPVPKQLAPLKVLVIDDDARYLRALGTLLRPAEVELRDNPVDGLVAVGVLRPDVVLLDVFMPGIDGIEVCRRLKRAPETRDIAVLAMSGSGSPDVQRQMREVGAAAFLRKPLTADGVLQELKKLGLVRPASHVGGGTARRSSRVRDE